MSRDDVVQLVGVTYTADSIGQRVPTEVQRQVYASVASVSASEFFAGGQRGLKPDKKITVFAPDYQGEDSLVFAGKRYAIYRTYIRDDEQIELYCEAKTGENVPATS